MFLRSPWPPAARVGARPRWALMLEVANPLADEALDLAAAAAGAGPRTNCRLRASPVVGGVLASLGPATPARDEPLGAVVVPAHVEDSGVYNKHDQ